jgi:hypothetical protein
MAGESVPGGGSPKGPSTPPTARHAPSREQKQARRRGRLTAIAVAAGLLVVLIVILLATGSTTLFEADSTTPSEAGSTTPSEAGSTAQVETVTITSCGPPTASGVVYVQGEASNTSAGRSDYGIEVAVESPEGEQIGTGTASVRNLEPGENAVWSTITDTTEESWVEGSTCKVLDVGRDASD